ncbi:prolyl aminopeptidase [Leucobacter sp. OLJS4]|nr:prolyl aminopeptidase [Leucobacter sp. OLCALW19]PII88400.1 prolyl aminopeptidase [Leucobacter sp. OLTLW20]PII92387.1 prolyl aminopeptidase [Leucobacter sp. OLAS13]PII98399.1 prolyl aminopeptidase [Leucobacter sp. OLCS4]PII99857.1 prolyl aminopeptidase [Leucobacter sp. OLDS2]PIJ03017.1 prolyl aminopeptidase [Leucobacter sp. OLIS6]PIJ13371.1 prolyl aminopeptidase [Leucobacter sp. OLJS4]PIJ52486.1 prolyl aminopeptidase [Leucobacter sp. OLES1]PIJ54125.1 prolyl aminopeptidase [Leucobacter sp.
MRTLYPAIEPNRSGLLPVGDGHEVFWEESGNPAGKPVVFLHGGPGGGCSPDHRRYFDPAKYRIVLFDQRGCGRSTPHASAPDADLSTNTTWHLVADIERLREHLGVDRWQVFGGSWGSTLALAYAQTHADRVTELVLRGIFTLRRSEIDWFYQEGASQLFPDVWEEYLSVIPEAERGDLVAAYHRRLFDADPAVHTPVGVAWTVWEHSTIRLIPDTAAIAAARTDTAMAVAFARIENHYFSNGGWMEDGQLIRDAAEKLTGIPGVIVQGRYDACTPATTAWDLHRAWPEAAFELIPDAGHAASEPGIVDALVRATDSFADR